MGLNHSPNGGYPNPAPQTGGDSRVRQRQDNAQAVEGIELDGQRRVVLDLTGLMLCDAGVSSLLKVNQSVHRQGGQLASNLRPRCWRVATPPVCSPVNRADEGRCSRRPWIRPPRTPTASSAKFGT